MSKLIHPIVLGKTLIANNLFQAPLAGVSCSPFRELIAEFGGVGYCATEMISAKTLLSHPRRRYIYKSPKEGRLCFQLSGNHPDELAEAALLAVSHGADLLDINCGCPVSKIRKKGCGSKLLSQAHKLKEIIKAIKTAVSLPLSIKIRVDGISGDRFNTDIVKAAEEGGADFLVVHGRHWSEHYEQAVRLDEIAAIVAASHIPVIGNGDIKDYASLQAMLATGCAGAMIGRASVGKPWLFAELCARDCGQAYTIPSETEREALFKRHIEGLALLENEASAMLQARGLAKYYQLTSDKLLQTP